MSRHRFVRNLDLDEERDDGALSDGGDEMTPEQHAQLEAALEDVRTILGSEAQSGFDDEFIREALWIVTLTSTRLSNGCWERKNAARERKEAGVALPDDDLVAKGMTTAQVHAARMAQIAEARNAAARDELILPSIQPMEDYNSTSDMDAYVPRLSTITERTERTEATDVPTRSSRSVATRRSAHAPSSVTDSSYGEVIESRLGQARVHVDPNTIRPSPPPSALRLSRNESAVIHSDDGESTRTVTPPPRAPSVPVPSLDSMPDIPDNQTRSARTPSSKLQRSNSAQRAIPVQVFRSSPPAGLFNPVDKPLPSLPPPSEPRHSIAESSAPSEPPRKSKLSALANSRVASSRATTVSRSSRMSSSSLGTSSVRTYPALRPSSESELSYIEEEEAASATSSMVRHAIQIAMNQEVVDKSVASPQMQGGEIQQDSVASSSSSSKSTAKPVSEVKADSPQTFVTAAESPVTSSSERPASKLSKLAQQAKSKQGPWMPKPKVARSSSPSALLRSTHTEYLTPIANGATATTAITTSYQSLDHLISPARSVLPPSFPPPGHVSSSASSPEPKQSKLAMKAKKPHHKRTNSAEDERPYLPVPVHTMFKPEGNRSRAWPSTFASILLDGVPLTPDDDKGHRKEHEKEKSHRERRSHSRSKPTSPLDESTANVKASSKHKSSAAAKAANIPLSPLGPFAFDVPSPDDIVFNARRGTSLGRSASDVSAPTAFPASQRPFSFFFHIGFSSFRFCKLGFVAFVNNVLTRLLCKYYLAAKELEKAQKLVAQKKAAEAQAASKAANPGPQRQPGKGPVLRLNSATLTFLL
ncbi:hypothetical protein BC834DRAFT_967953 [Gloeopeniophorella convolvens]|nr:hypothetical protein BC834DRAFT_967953 [Gloeopeniophorella convolvens]